MTRKHQETGFTLIELTVVIVVVTILALMLTGFVTTYLEASSLAQSRSNLLTNAEIALDTMADDVRLSGSIDLNNRWADANGPGGNQFGWTSGSNILILAEAAADKTNNIIFSDPSKYISQKDNEIYFVSGTTLYRRTLQSDSANDAAVTTCPPANANGSCPADRTIATGVSNLTFTYYDANENVVTPDNARSVQASLTLTSTLGGQTAKATYTTRMVFRNE